ncbi:MAG TPA: hypothetical protein VMJ13_05630, partial [Candidatus Acidoferrum sp.]|nr:hypothetical protein [Candidatus Acidoferrum sp.]
VHVRQADPGQLGSGCDRSGYGVGDVVEFEVEEDIKTKARELLDSARAFGGEKLAADFEHPCGTF